MQKKKSERSPLMQQYHDIKVHYSDALLLFQVGDFYELFFDDAKTAAAFLGIALTARGKNKGEPIPLCGVPVHAKDHYVVKLVKGGFKVALCEQLEPPKPGSIVKRGVTQVLTPGTLTDTQLLDEKSASYLFTFFPMADQWGLLFGELLTAQLFATVIKAGDQKKIDAELARFFPDEIVIPKNKLGKLFQPFFKKAGYCVTPIEVDVYQEKEETAAWIKKQFKPTVVNTIEKHESLRLALYYFYAYVRRNQKTALDQFRNLHVYKTDDFLYLDQATQRNLELVKNTRGGVTNTLFSVMDGATTAMGSRMIKKWLLRPLVKKEAIVQRQDVIDRLIQDIPLSQQLTDILVQIGDIERVVGRIGVRRALLHDYLMLMRALSVIPTMCALLQKHIDCALLQVIYQHIGDFSLLHQLLCAALNDDPSKDWHVKTGFDEKLDRLRQLVHNSHESIVQLEKSEREKTGIQSLKIRYNQVHGYYIELTKTKAHLVPDYYKRQQTLVAKERFIIPQLQQLQVEIMRARTEIEQVEQVVFDRVKADVLSQVASLRKLSHALAHLDALLGFAHIAYSNGYVRPLFNDVRTICIEQGRHPVIEQTSDGPFIPNDTNLTDEQSLWIITGPNMGGKSTYLRQVALITVLAQTGSFVPATKANVPLLDRLFTRIGAGDNLAEGKSTFLVEMEETATICTQATEKSLVILDEVGRGTSTFDGLAIAHAVVEYIHNKIKARCLFATHYHELTQLQDQISSIAVYYAASKKTRDGIVFLYNIVQGVADGSFGIEVAKLAQLPPEIITRAQLLLQTLMIQAPNHISSGEKMDDYMRVFEENKQLKQEVMQVKKTLEMQKDLLQVLSAVDYNELSPKKAFDLLWDLKEKG